MLSKYYQIVKSWVEHNRSDLYIAAIIFLVGMASFGLGRLSVLWPKKEPITVTNDERLRPKANVGTSYSQRQSSALSAFGVRPSANSKYVASKSGTAYHYPWCQGALKIKEENKIWFQTKEDAVKAGYKPAGNCEGL